VLQQVIVWIGLLWTIAIMYRIGRSCSDTAATIVVGSLPHVLLAAIVTLVPNRALYAPFST
jgi:hypothetical protein